MSEPIVSSRARRVVVQEPVPDILAEVASDFRRALRTAAAYGVSNEQIVLDVGIGFGKSIAQNLELLAKLDKLKAEFSQFPFLIGASRKSFIGRVVGKDSASERLSASIATVAIAVWNGANIVRAHDVKETVESLRMVEAARKQL